MSKHDMAAQAEEAMDLGIDQCLARNEACTYLDMFWREWCVIVSCVIVGWGCGGRRDGMVPIERDYFVHLYIHT